MSTRRRSPGLSRRQFLQAAGAATLLPELTTIQLADASDASPAPFASFTAASDYSPTTQGQVWFYQSSPAGVQQYANLAPGAGAWTDGDDRNIRVGPGHLRPTRQQDAVRTWVAPITGAVQITGRVYQQAYHHRFAGGSPVRASVFHGATPLWTTTVASNDVRGFYTDAVLNTVPVSAGDTLHFVVSTDGAELMIDMAWDPRVTYVHAPVTHTTYYISAAGSDANSGAAPEHPWRTVAPLNAIRFFGEDVHILFRGGDTFAGGLNIMLTGRSGHRCPLGAYGQGQATLTDLHDGTTDVAQSANSEQFTVRNLRFIATAGTNYGTFHFIPGNHNSGLKIYSTQSRGRQLRSIAIENCEFQHSMVGLFLNAHTDGVDGFADVSVRNRVFDRTYRLGVFVWGIKANAGGPVDQHRNVSVEECQFRHIYGDPHFPSEAQPIYIGNTTGIAIQRNLVAHCCGYGGYNPLGGATAIGVTNSRTFTIQYNEVFDTRSNSAWDGSAIDADQDTRNGEISYNLTYRNAGPAIQFGSYGGKITRDIAIHHNISYNDARGNKRSSIQGVIRAWGNADRIAVFNNPVYLDRAGTIGTPSILSFEGGDFGVNTHVMVYNNIFKTTQGVPMIRPNGTVLGEYSPTYLDATVRFVANLYDSSGASPTLSTDDTTGSNTPVTTLTSWHAVGQEALGSTRYGWLPMRGWPLLARSARRLRATTLTAGQSGHQLRSDRSLASPQARCGPAAHRHPSCSTVSGRDGLSW